MLDYADLLLTTYSEYDTEHIGGQSNFTFIIHNPTRADGDITVTAQNGAFFLTFFTMQEEPIDDFGDLVAFIDELLHDETMIFEVFSHGEDVLGGSRGTDEIDIDHTIPRFVKSLSDSDPDLLAELRAIIAKGNCHVCLRGWHPSRCRSIILSR